MASYLPRRLTKLYSDTKQDMVAEQAKLENVPQLNALQRKFRIQKDRLVTWGLEWSDNSTTAPEGSIDESIARAGMTETVTSVLKTIQDILDEADHISRSAEHEGSDKRVERSPGKSSGSRFWTPADRTRYVELAEQLATSIDTLHGISRSRRAIDRGNYQLETEEKLIDLDSSPPITTQKSFDDVDAYNDSMLTLISPPNQRVVAGSEAPEKLDPTRLVLPEEELPPYEIVGAPSCTRLVGHLKQLDSSSNQDLLSDSSPTPVLVEYVGYDPTFRLAGVSPPQERLEQLLEVLSLGVGRFGDGPDAPGFGTLKCLGYFEDPKQPRYGFVFELPSFVSSGMMRSLRAPEIQALRPVTLLSILQVGSKSHGAQNTPGVTYTPPLEQRFRIALNLVLSFSKLHSSGFEHKDVNSSNILFFYKNGRVHHLNHRKPEYELRSPYLCSFDVFSDYNVETSTVENAHMNIYRHPHDPRTGYSEHRDYTPYFDMYSLGLILLEVGMWLPLADLFKSKYTLADFKIRLEDIWIRKLSGKCGTAYMQAVRDCISAADKCLSLAEIKTTYDRILRRLHRCCLLDETDPYEPNSRSYYSPPDFARVPKHQERMSGQFTNPSMPLLKGSYPYEIWPEHHQDSRREPGLPHYHGVEVRSTSESWLMDPINAHYGGYKDTWNPDDISKTNEGQHGLTKGTSPSIYKENLATAASTIQRAWRTHRIKVSFREYRRKVIIVQKHWRQRKEQRALAQLGTPRPSLQRLGEDSYPTPESNVATNDTHINAFVRMKQHCQRPKRKLLVQPLWQPTPEIAMEWDRTLLPRLMRICERALKDSTESSSIDLFGVGSSPSEAKATIVVTCTNTTKVKCVLARKFSYDRAVYDLKVHKGKVKRSKLTRPSRRRRPPHRSMMEYTEDESNVPAFNKHFQQRPVCGASIGAYNGEHLPPVSYGGVILVDGEPFGMSVHHMLDAPSEDESDYEDDISDIGSEEVVRSSSHVSSYPWTSEIGTQLSPQDSVPMAFEISDDEDFEDEASDFQDDSTSESSDNESETTASEAGDVPGIDVGDGDEITITQPAIDDVDDDFFPCEEDREEDHLDSHELGHVYASSGIRRWNREGVLHEIDWSLLKLNDERLQPYNLVQGGKRYFKDGALCPKLVDPVNRLYYGPEDDEYPSRVAKAEDLASLRVHCFGRTSGLKGGVISNTMTAVKVHGRKSYARSWLVTGGLGVGGDSGAWVIDNEQGRVCGHILAWCNRNHVAYICPMEVLLEDIRRTLGACKVVLPGSEEAEEEETDTEENGKESFDLSEIKSLSIDEVQVARDVRTALKSMDGPARIDLYGRRNRQMA
ncbi:uncharacterized protein K452DRAFT_233046 [Aplosporella prunicola CBS 121167]|uniref:Protein kinase domain-containing protein n=1 Tax=Aplosporella prunicola CBS 121167 TaxID=1176127 RepID=A0A6A6B674_9PEZI|nr:uncharacterized protein K452DRAFT_233046 [Aplosporella prunicola CBS 121167]KAF2139138.1 hypothetical protein K452DRAFT_233046 [Aplosporella prunicola CBS 121167]